MFRTAKSLCNFMKFGFLASYNGCIKPLLPLSVFIILTTRCNSRCIYCEAYASDLAEELTTQEINSIIEQISRKGINSLTLGGGEPFLRKDIFDILKSSRAHNLDLTILTNGLTMNRLSPVEIDTIRSCVKHFFISIDSAIPEENDYIRGRKGALGLALAGIEHLRKSGFTNITIATVISKFNYENLDKLLYLMKDIGVSMIKFQPVAINSNFPQINPPDKTGFLIPDKQLSLLSKNLDNLIKIADKLGITTNLKFSNSWICSYFKYLMTDKFFMKEIDRHFKCVLPSMELLINSEGKLQPCTYLDEVGDCRKEAIAMWRKNKEMQDIRRRLKAGELFNQCRSCVCVFESNFIYRFWRNFFKSSFLASVFLKMKQRI